MNHKHLYYFWKVASLKGILAASRAIHITPHTLSGQINLLEERLGVELFRKNGRTLELTPAGEVAFEHAQEIFTISSQLEQMLRFYPKGQATLIRLGVANDLPKTLVYELLKPLIYNNNNLPTPRIICREWDNEKLMADLAMHRLDLVISDHPPIMNIKSYHHKLGSSPLIWLINKKLLPKKTLTFPKVLEHIPVLLPGEQSYIRRVIDEWINRHGLKVQIVGEFDDLALISAFGKEAVGAYVIPEILIKDYTKDKNLVVLGALNDVWVNYYAITVHRHLNNQLIKQLIEHANINLKQ